MQAENRRFETMTLVKTFLEVYFYKNFACFAGKKRMSAHQKFWAAYCFSKVRFSTCTDLYIYIYFIIYYYY